LESDDESMQCRRALYEVRILMLAAQILHRLRQLVALRHKRLSGAAARRRQLSLWQLVPTADANDVRWRGHPVWDDVIVRAETANEAYAVAAALLGNDDGAAASPRDMFALRELPAADELDAGEGTILSLRLRGRRPISREATGPASP
jgi:hypothetical protein